MASKPAKGIKPAVGKSSKPAKNSGASDGKPRSAVAGKQGGRVKKAKK